MSHSLAVHRALCSLRLRYRIHYAGLCPLFSLAYAARLDLHSFPTRRSSDLDPRRLRGVDQPGREQQLHGVDVADLLDQLHGRAAERIDRPADLRSEEHTSELQSHSDLVCRLLLEKKKMSYVTLPRCPPRVVFTASQVPYPLRRPLSSLLSSLRRPPGSPLFPYTTLFRSRSAPPPRRRSAGP